MPQIDDLHGDAQAVRNAAVLGDERKIGFREGGDADQFAAVIVKGKELEALLGSEQLTTWHREGPQGKDTVSKN